MSDESEAGDDFDRRIRLLAARRAQAIVKNEGAALVLSACDSDDAAVESSQALAIAIAQALIDAYAGDLGGGEDEQEVQ